MGVIRTVLGDVAPGSLGIVNCHEHLMITGGPVVDADPDLLLNDVEDAVAEVRGFLDAGGQTIVDAMPTACGRDADSLVKIARQTGAHIIATAGFHRPHFYGDLHWACRHPRKALTEVIVDEAEKGIDRWDLAGPSVDRLEVRPGLLKVATGLNTVDRIERRLLEAVAFAQSVTDLPVITHAEQGTAADRQLSLLAAVGVPPSRIALGHVDRNLDWGLHRELVERGAFLLYDSLYREHHRSVGDLAEMILRLVDSGRRSLRVSGGGLGVAGLLSSLVPALKERGVGPGTLDTILIANPARFLEIPGTV